MHPSHIGADDRPQGPRDCGDPRPLPPHVLHTRLAQIAREHPSLCTSGFIHQANDRGADFALRRRELLLHTDTIAAVQQYIWADWPILYCEGRVNSYALKHEAENYLTEIGEYQYISHGAAIAAALVSGFTIKPERLNSPNVAIIFRSRGRRWAGCGQMTQGGWA